MASFPTQLMSATLRKVLKRLHYPVDVMLVCVRWYAAYPLSLRNLEQMMAERGVIVDHATVYRWALKILPVLAALFRRRKRPVGQSWHMDETYVKVAGQWKYLYRAVDRLGQTVDFLLTAHRDVTAARRFFERAIDLHDVPETITIDKSGANTAAVHGLVADSGLPIAVRQSKYLNNLVEQDPRVVKRRTRPMLGFKAFPCAARLIAGIETMHRSARGSTTAPKAQTCAQPSTSTRWRSEDAAGALCLHVTHALLRQIRSVCVLQRVLMSTDRASARWYFGGNCGQGTRQLTLPNGRSFLAIA